MRVAIYVRVSTQEQAKEGYSISEQLERLQKYCDAMTWVIHKKYIDPGYSGANTERPALQELIKDVKAGLIDKVVVYKLDRLSRSQLDTLYLIEKVFLENNVDFVSMNENFDTSTPFGRAMIGILAVFAQLEREQIKERMIMGKEARIKEGKWHGGKVPIGYDYNPLTKLLTVNEYEKMQVVEIFDLFLKGTPIQIIETIFLNKGYKHKYGKWCSTTIKYVLNNKLYAGFINHYDTYYKGLHKPLITLETYEQAQEIFRIRKENYSLMKLVPGKVTSYLGGLIRCKHCGAKYSKQLSNHRKDGSSLIYYSCGSRSKKSKKSIKNPNCKNKNWNMKELDSIILGEIKKLSLDYDYIDTLKSNNKIDLNLNKKIEIINSEIEKIDKQISRFMDLYGLGNFTIEQVNNKVKPLMENKSELEKELKDLRTNSKKLSTKEVINIVNSFDDIIKRGNFDEIRLVIESLISYIELDNENVYIHWSFI